jgi:hypothetical protein
MVEQAARPPHKLVAPLGGGGSSTLTVSGTVNWSGHSLSNYCVSFLDTSRTTTIYPVGVTQVNTGSGAYTIQVELGGALEAYVEAFDDVNNNGTVDAGDGFGWWGQNNNGEWDDMLTFQPGQTVTSANIALQTLQLRNQLPKQRIANPWLFSAARPQDASPAAFLSVAGGQPAT